MKAIDKSTLYSGNEAMTALLQKMAVCITSDQLIMISTFVFFGVFLFFFHELKIKAHAKDKKDCVCRWWELIYVILDGS